MYLKWSEQAEVIKRVNINVRGRAGQFNVGNFHVHFVSIAGFSKPPSPVYTVA